MLRLINIKKDYQVADTKIHALKGVSLNFRDSEFVSILGPSGCGKTTMLNIIGGLDHYTLGDLEIDGISTKQYGDRDWDTYRNHRIGFIFQSYNLIPHQTVLENVELALNISGVEKAERIKRAKEALDKVGLSSEYYKKPNQLSGGQCQRVAIARALVGDPEILLADEPTGALDTQTSLQIMALIKEISKDRLVIMVTHNPELAEKYSTRIIKLLDGEVVSDSSPFTPETEKVEDKPKRAKKVITKKSKLSLWSAFKLSARNLKSKFKRTFLVCLAGSIGIIGVSSVLSVSTGIQNYIYSMQDDMLSGNPITISEMAFDFNKITNMQNLSGGEINKIIEDGKINVDYVIENLIKSSENINSLTTENNITKEYIDYLYQMPKEYYAAITKNYGLDISNNIYTNYNFSGLDNTPKMSLSSALKTYTSMLEDTEYKNLSPLIATLEDTFMQLPDDEEYIMSQYEYCTSPETSYFPTKPNEIMLVVSKDVELTDVLLASLGYYTQEEFLNIMFRANEKLENGESESSNYNPELDKDRFTYDELKNKVFTYYPNSDIYAENDSIKTPFTYNHIMSEDGYDFKITAIVKPKENLSYGSLKSGFYYTSKFTERVLEDAKNSNVVEYLRTNKLESFSNNMMIPTSKQITYEYSYQLDGEEVKTKTGYVGSISDSSKLISAWSSMAPPGAGGGMGTSMPSVYELTLRNLGGSADADKDLLPNELAIYPTNFDYKDFVIEYLNEWNNEGNIIVNGKTLTKADREDIVYTDALTLVIGLINTLINVVTTALICFTALSLVVSTVMIAIITYVSVIERVKEIGVIRSLGGRKKDVSHLFNAETFIIGSLSGLIGVLFTYLLSAIINVIVKNLVNISSIAILTIPTALIMIAISIILTSISGIVPASLAAKKDPVDALRTE